MLHLSLLALGAAAVRAQYVPPPNPVLLTATKSGVLPVAPTPFTGLETLQGAIIKKAPVKPGYTGVLGPAEVQTNPQAASYSATLPEVAFNALTGTTIRGTLQASTTAGQTGVTFSLQLTNLPDLTAYGPFAYHIHDMPVPADGNCTATMGHLDTQNVGEYYTCDTANPQNCQTGDLSGKHGKITTSPSFNASYTDKYLSTTAGSLYSLVGKSIVIHTANTTRLTCANFVAGAQPGAAAAAGNGTSSAGGSASGSTPATNGTSGGSSSNSPSSTALPPAQYTGGASRMNLVGAAAVAAAAGIAALM